MMVRTMAMKLFHGPTPPSAAPAAHDQPEAIENERIAGEDEEQQDALENPGDLVGDAERDLRRLAAEIAQAPA